MYNQNPSSHTGIDRAVKEEQKFMQFQITRDDLVLLPARRVIEIRPLEAKEILPVPQLSEWVLGMCQWRGEMLWVIDLANLVGLPPLAWQQSNFLMVLQVEKKTLGLAVYRVTGIEDFDLTQLYPPSAELFSSELLPFLQGFFLTEKQKSVKLLNPEALIDCHVSKEL